MSHEGQLITDTQVDAENHLAGDEVARCVNACMRPNIQHHHHHHQLCFPSIDRPIDLSDVSAEEAMVLLLATLNGGGGGGGGVGGGGSGHALLAE